MDESGPAVGRGEPVVELCELKTNTMTVLMVGLVLIIMVATEYTIRVFQH